MLIVPSLDRSDLLHYTTHTVLHNLTEGIVLVVIILFLFLGKLRGALDFGMVVDGTVVIAENIVRHLSHNKVEDRTPMEIIREAAHEVQRPAFYAIAIIITAYLPIFTLQSVEGRLFKPMSWTVASALVGAFLFSIVLAPVLSSFLFRKGTTEWENPVLTWMTAGYRRAAVWPVEHRWAPIGTAILLLAVGIFLTDSGVIGSEFLPHLDEGAI